MIRVKICGITRPEDALAAATAGADFLGLVFANSPRQINSRDAGKIIRGIPKFKNWTGVFVDENPENIARIAFDLKIPCVQLHGNESSEDCRSLALKGLQVIKALRVRGSETLEQMPRFETSYILLDSFFPSQQGGTGISFDWNLLKNQTGRTRIFISGGLDIQSVPKLFKIFIPYGVDVSSGVEDRPGIKNETKIKQFIQTVKQAQN